MPFWPLSLISGLSCAIGTALAVFAAVTVTVSVCRVHDALFDDPAVAKAAREGMVSKYEVESAKALRDALAIAAKASIAAADEAQRRQLMLSRIHEIQADRMESEIAKLETDLAATGRACRLDRSDIDRLRNAGRAVGGRGKNASGG